MTEEGQAARTDHRIALCLLADPGVPLSLAKRLAEVLPDELSRSVSRRVSWTVTTESARLPVDEHGEVQLAGIARDHSSNGEGIVVGLTDHPRRAGVVPLVADASIRDGVALAFVPALGAARSFRRARELVVRLVAELVGGRLAHDGHPEVRGDHPHVTAVRRVPADDKGGDLRWVGVGARARLRLLAGMVRANRPWRLVPAMSGVFAGALATGAYVLVSSNIWLVADSLGGVRLTGAMIFAMTALTAWLIVDHHLWERPTATTSQEQVVLYNVATGLTIGLGVLFLYVGLLALAFAANALVIDSKLLGRELGHTAGWSDRAVIAWMAASLGTVAGAIGSSLESDEAARQAAYGYRQRQRQAIAARQAAREEDAAEED